MQTSEMNFMHHHNAWNFSKKNHNYVYQIVWTTVAADINIYMLTMFCLSDSQHLHLQKNLFVHIFTKYPIVLV